MHVIGEFKSPKTQSTSGHHRCECCPHDCKEPHVFSGLLCLEPLSRGSTVYTGSVAAVVVGCLAFDPHCRRLVSFDGDRTVSIVDDLRLGLASGFRLALNTLVAALAADCQQIESWPVQAFGIAQADVVVTPSRAVLLGTGDTIPLTGENRHVNRSV